MTCPHSCTGNNEILFVKVYSYRSPCCATALCYRGADHVAVQQHYAAVLRRGWSLLQIVHPAIMSSQSPLVSSTGACSRIHAESRCATAATCYHGVGGYYYHRGAADYAVAAYGDDPKKNSEGDSRRPSTQQKRGWSKGFFGRRRQI